LTRLPSTIPFLQESQEQKAQKKTAKKVEVGPPGNMMAIFTESYRHRAGNLTELAETELAIQRYDDRSASAAARTEANTWHVPAHRGHLRVVMANDAE